jgi:uncharacterized protein (DUF885 family)
MAKSLLLGCITGRFEEKAESKMDSKFDIKKFHEKVLESGVLPLALLEKKINDWIDGK